MVTDNSLGCENAIYPFFLSFFICLCVCVLHVEQPNLLGEMIYITFILGRGTTVDRKFE
jgi:hypothetical protein